MKKKKTGTSLPEMGRGEKAVVIVINFGPLASLPLTLPPPALSLLAPPTPSVRVLS
jgi:hypothetical protein